MILYIVRSKALRSNGQYFVRGEVLTAEDLRDIAFKVASDNVVKINTDIPRDIRKVRMLEQRLGMSLMGKIQHAIQKATEKTTEQPIKEESTETKNIKANIVVEEPIKKAFPLPKKK